MMTLLKTVLEPTAATSGSPPVYGILPSSSQTESRSEHCVWTSPFASCVKSPGRLRSQQPVRKRSLTTKPQMNTTSRIIVPLVAALSITIAGWPFCSVAQSVATAEARGIRIVGAGEGADFQDYVRPFNWGEGTSVALLVRRAEGGIIDIDRDDSTVTRFEDSTGTDLLKKPKQRSTKMMFTSQSGFGSMPDIKKDGTAAMLELSGPGLPAKEATELKVQGTVSLVCANTKKRFTQELELKVGSKVTVGPVPLEITKVGKPDWGDAAMAVTFKATQKLDGIAGISFSSQGQKIETKDGGYTSMQSFNIIKVEKTINFPRKVVAATIEIEAWQDMKHLEVPFNLTVGLGL